MIKLADNILDSEKALLAKIAEGDALAFKVVYEKYYDPIFKFAYRLLHSAELAEEVIQETMLYVWQLGQKLHGIDNFEAYVKTIARRRAIDLLRINEQALVLERDLLASTDITEPTNEEALLLESARVALEKGIEKLPDQQRQVYIMCYHNGLKYQEVADRLGISHGTVQTHMKLALKYLREYIRKHGHVAAIAVIFKLL